MRLFTWFLRFFRRNHDQPPIALHICVDRYLPGEGSTAPLLRGGTGNDHLSSDLLSRGAMVRDKMWSPVGRTLRVTFLDGHPAVQQQVMRFAQEWSRHANLHFMFVDPASPVAATDQAPAEIRISFAQPGSWSYIGTDALNVPAAEPTMNFGWLTPGTPLDEVQRVVLHEFGHAIGLIHEHQHPQVAIPWHRDAVYAYYSGPPNYWSREQVDLNLFQRYAAAQTQYSAFDPASIMLYPVPSEFTTDGSTTGWNQVLSPLDQAFVGACYPFDGQADG